MSEPRVWFNGRIWTGRRYVARVVADGDRIVASDDGGSSGPEVPTGAGRIDLAGRLAVPAFLDAHLHLTETARFPAGIDLRGTTSLAMVGERVREAALRQPLGALWGGGWDQERFAERRMPTGSDLDGWLGDRPLVLTRVCGHVAVANSAARAAMGLTPSAPDEPGGTIERDEAGEPNGVLRERALRWLDRFPYPNLHDRPELGERLLANGARRGIGTWASMRASVEEVRWMGARPAGPREPPVPGYLAFGAVRDVADLEAWARRRRAGAPGVVGAKLFADGSFGSRGAWLREPYDDAPAERGGPLVPPGDWAELLRRADDGGLRVAAHALGDAALSAVLDGIEAARPSRPVRIEHVGLAPPDLLDRIARSGADAVVQPGFRTSDRWLPERLGPERVRFAYPLSELRGRGVRLAGSSDAPVEPFDPVEGIRSACDPSAIGQPLAPADALALYTTGAAAVLDRPEAGGLEHGQEASLVVLEARAIEDLPRLPEGAPRTVWLRGRAVPPAG